MLDRAAAELADTERMVEAAERLYGPYRWGRYDVIVLPPSFPYGGMENPTLDLPDADLHRRRPQPGRAGRARAGAQLVGQSRHQRDLGRFLAQRGLHLLFREPDHGGGLRPGAGARRRSRLSWDDMQAGLRELGADLRRATALHDAVDDPDGGSSGIVYDKGAIFLRTIERIVGRARLRRLAALLFRPPRLPADDLRAVPRRPARQPHPGRRGRSSAGCSSTAGSTSPACPTMRRGPIPAAFAAVDAAAQAFNAGGAAARRALCRLELGGAGALPQGPAARSCRAPGSPSSTAPSACRKAAMPRCCSSGSGSRSRNRYEPAVPAAERFLLAMGRRKFVAAAVPGADRARATGAGRSPSGIYARARPATITVTAGRRSTGFCTPTP